MGILTERVSFTLPAEMKAQLTNRARSQGISLSALVRNITDDLLAAHALQIAVAEYERKEPILQ